MQEMQNWDPRIEDFNDLNYSTVRGGPASNYVRQPMENKSGKGVALYVANIPCQMSKNDFTNYLSIENVTVLDVINLANKNNSNSRQAIVKVEDIKQGLYLIEKFNCKPPINLKISKARPTNSNKNIDYKMGGFQVGMKPTQLKNSEQCQQQNSRRPNKLYANNTTENNDSLSESSENLQNSTPANSVQSQKGIKHFPPTAVLNKTLSVESVKANLEERFKDMNINYVDVKPKVERQILETSSEIEMKNSVCSSSSSGSQTKPIKHKRQMKCIFCGDLGFERCSICFAYYCSKACQLDDWFSHKEKCTPPPILISSEDEPLRNPIRQINTAIIQDNTWPKVDPASSSVSVEDYISEQITDTTVDLSNLQLKSNAVTNKKSSEVTNFKPSYNKFHFNKLKKFPLEMGKNYKIFPSSISENLFIRLKSDHIDKELNDFSQKTKSFFQQGTPDINMNPIDLVPGELFCTYDQTDDSYYRTQVVAIRGKIISAYYVDYGNTEEVSYDNARIFDASFLDMPVVCVELKNLTSSDGIISLDELCQNYCYLYMKVSSMNPLTVDLSDDKEKLLFTSRCSKENPANSTPESLSIESPKSNPAVEKITLPHPNSDYVSKISTINCGELYSKTYEETASLSLPIEAGVPVLTIYNNLMPIINVIPEANIELLEKLEVLSNDIQNYCNEKSNENYKPQVNEVVLALYDKDELWYRAAVLSVSEDSADVIFVDYGNMETVSFSHFLPMLKDFMKLPVLAVTCAISDLPDELSTQEKEYLMDIVNNDFAVDVATCEDFVYKISIPSLQNQFQELMAKRT